MSSLDFQTTYPTTPPVGYAGDIANTSERQVDTYANASGGELPFGYGVVQTGDHTATKPTSVSQPLLGVVVRSGRLGAAAGSKAAMDVLTFGDVFVLPEEAVSFSDPVYMRVTASGDEVAGAFRKSSDGGDAVRIPGASWFKSGSSTSPAILRLRLSGGETTSEIGAEETHVVSHVAVTADTTVFAFTVPAGRTFILDSATYINPTGLAQDATNYFDIKVVRGATVMANWSTLTGAQGTIAADTEVTLVNAVIANRTAPGGTRIDVLLDETGTASLPAGTVTIHGRLI